MKKENDSPLISVIMGVYDEPVAKVELAVRSILGQTYSNIELVICLDLPSNGEVAEYLRRLAVECKTFKLLENEENIGLGFSLNRCLEICAGEYIARMDSDDISRPDRLEKQLDYLRKCGNKVVCFTEVDMINSAGEVVPRFFPNNGNFKDHFFKADAFVHATLMMHRDLYLRYQYKISHSPEDYEMYFRMVRNGVGFVLLNERLYQYNFNAKLTWRSLNDRCSRTRKTALIMLPLLWKNFDALYACKGYIYSLAKYSAMAMMTIHPFIYNVSSRLYTPFRNK